MRYNKKNTKKAIQRKLTTRKRWKNNRSLPRRTQYKTHKSYKQMRGGLTSISTTTVKELLNPSNDNPSKFEANSPMFVGALIISSYNHIKGNTFFERYNLPDIPSTSQSLTAAQLENIKAFTLVYHYSKIDKPLSQDDFYNSLIYVLQGEVYKTNLPHNSEEEKLQKFNLLGQSLVSLWNYYKGRKRTDQKKTIYHPPSSISRENREYGVGLWRDNSPSNFNQQLTSVV